MTSPTPRADVVHPQPPSEDLLRPPQASPACSRCFQQSPAIAHSSISRLPCLAISLLAAPRRLRPIATPTTSMDKTRPQDTFLFCIYSVKKICVKVKLRGTCTML
ncbi:hypothetical protein L1887_12327 [Cichorium endivia]|nr:hypothetical protein L1887_12327 [Cichorium endivia]